MRVSAGRFGVLEERDFRFVFLAGAVSQIGDQMMPVAIAFAVLDLTGSAADLGYVLAAGTAPLVALLLAGGVFADRFSRRRLMFTADGVRLATDGTLAALLVSGQARLWELIVLQALHGAASAFFAPASTGIVPQLVPEHGLQQANALRGMTLSIGGIVGPAIAGALVATAGPGWAIGANAATFGVSALFLVRVHAPALERTAAAPSFLGDLIHGWREFKSRTWLWTIVAQFSLLHLVAIAPFFALGAVIAKRSLGGAGAWSLILAVFAVGTLVGGAVSLRFRPQRPLVVGTAWTAGLALPIGMLALGLGAVEIAAGAFVAGLGLSIFEALWSTTLQREVPRESLSRVSAYDWFGSIATIPIGYALTGVVAGAIGASTVLWIGAGAVLVSTAAVLAVPDVRRMSRGPIPSPDAEVRLV
jgi:predicted MFS family arabinose efflux permease